MNDPVGRSIRQFIYYTPGILPRCVCYFVTYSSRCFLFFWLILTGIRH